MATQSRSSPKYILIARPAAVFAEDVTDAYVKFEVLLSLPAPPLSCPHGCTFWSCFLAFKLPCFSCEHSLPPARRTLFPLKWVSGPRLSEQLPARQIVPPTVALLPAAYIWRLLRHSSSVDVVLLAYTQTWP